jgi:hypothetical protein
MAYEEEARVPGEVHHDQASCGTATGASRFLIGLVTCWRRTTAFLPYSPLTAPQPCTPRAWSTQVMEATLTRHLDTGDLDTLAHITDTLLHRLEIPPPC